jgi:hypothetical protein
MAVKSLNVVCILFWCVSTAFAFDHPKASLLEKKISISFSNISIPQALQKIEVTAGVVFSYSPTIFSSQSTVDKQFTNVSVRQLLDQLFEGDIVYKERKKYIILTKGSSRSKEQVAGYISDSKTGERLRNVSIYNPVTMESVITDEYGFFVMPIAKPSNEELKLTIKRLDYADTVISIKQDKRRLLDITLDKTTNKLSVAADSVSARVKRIWLATKKLTEQSVHLRNIDDTLRQPFQFSVVPFVGTNMKLSGNTVNDYSLNLIGGYSKGVRKLEVGGVFNTVNGHVQGIQMAGSVNVVTGNVEAVQIAGAVNVNNGDVRGMQWAGFANINRGSSKTLSGAGMLNILGAESSGAKFAGFGNLMIKRSNDVALAGFYNIALDSMKGAQIAGYLNVARGPSKGVQISGFINSSEGSFEGTQIAILNSSGKHKGVQVGLVNVADSMQGVPIGLFSFVRKNGYHKLEIATEEVFNANLSFRTGVHQFYNILTLGAQYETFSDDETLWTFGYGLGTAPRLSKKWYLNIDATSNQVMKGSHIDYMNVINKLFVGAEYQVFKKISIAGGLTLNMWVAENNDAPLDMFTNYSPKLLYDEPIGNNHHCRMWLGGKLALRFF